MFVVVFVWMTGGPAMAAEQPAADLADQRAEGPLDAFLGEPQFEKQVVFEGGGNVREPYLAVAVDGTVLVMRNYARQLRRSQDGGRTWSQIVEVPFGFMDSNFVIDDHSGHLMSVRLWDGQDRLWRSRDHGQTWTEEPITLRFNQAMKQWEQSGEKTRGVRDPASGGYYLHANASEAGITLRHSDRRGRLLVTATYRPHAPEHPSDRRPEDAIRSTAIYSDDGGTTWQVSDWFPEAYTEEAALVELHDGRIYYNTRSHAGFHDRTKTRPLAEHTWLRRSAISRDGGQTWEDLQISRVLIDGGGYGRGYGMKGGLVRLPIRGRDILLYSNADTAGGERERMTIWTSFDGGETWPVKRLIDAGPSAYSSLAAGRPGTSSEGQIFLLFEGGPTGRYDAMQLARMNLAWLLDGQATGDGNLPDWLSR
ncbi:MAG: exo-alpha-sialidase [Planctomycetaceae bacterium]|nr:MAG: exo-alpha-sialidase [Planctomycetaceae bacterium]